MCARRGGGGAALRPKGRGFNDRHLDFRLIVDVTPSGEARQVTATTLVRTHNRLGRLYLAIIMPFHRLIVPAMLRRVAA